MTTTATFAAKKQPWEMTSDEHETSRGIQIPASLEDFNTGQVRIAGQHEPMMKAGSKAFDQHGFWYSSNIPDVAWEHDSHSAQEEPECLQASHEGVFVSVRDLDAALQAKHKNPWHAAMIKNAVKAGKPVPSHVLAEYPGLAATKVNRTAPRAVPTQYASRALAQTTLAVYADLYSALFWATIEPERYAKPSSPGQMSLFGDEPAAEQPPTPWTATAYQGTGRAEQASVYKHGPGAVFQGASYYALSPEHAKQYGPEVTEHQVTLQRPRHVTNDQQWHELAAEAGVKPSLNMGAMDPGAIRQAAAALQQHLVARGHDGLVVQGVDRTKWPSRIFGHDQVVKFGEPATSAQTPFGKGKGESLFTDPRPPASQQPSPAPDPTTTPFEQVNWNVIQQQGKNGPWWEVRHPDRPTIVIGAGSSRNFAVENAKRLWGQNYPFFGPREKYAESSQMITRPAAAPATSKRLPFPPNHVIAEVRDHEGELLGHELEPHEGTPDSIREANGRLRARLDDLHPTWSNVMTRTGATNEQAHPQWVVSPNSRNVYEAGTQEARDLMGWTSTPAPEPPRAIEHQRSQAEIDQHPAVVAAKTVLDKIQGQMARMNRQGQTGTNDPVRRKQWMKAHGAYLRAVEDAKREPPA